MAAPTFMTITGHGAVIPLAQPQCLNQLLTERLEPQPLAQHITTTVSVQDPHKSLAPQEFTSASIGGPSMYKEYQQA